MSDPGCEPSRCRGRLNLMRIVALPEAEVKVQPGRDPEESPPRGQKSQERRAPLLWRRAIPRIPPMIIPGRQRRPACCTASDHNQEETRS